MQLIFTDRGAEQKQEATSKESSILAGDMSNIGIPPALHVLIQHLKRVTCERGGGVGLGGWLLLRSCPWDQIAEQHHRIIFFRKTVGGCCMQKRSSNTRAAERFPKL